ncbi:hypothetical protein IE81DRAFT_174624 [Ceraceosorus guamensis]|uniref:Secreted protein n=1 Tax=Ceraceosorus guamensis TaxID=1522189 RepID=A0A316VVJ8_9BASI|nr:hypothetical protein IE81DRAFT_174624 [Ceraceosorus guamensis]PWN41510.1 hypothetical protein IE81DRAFT_174624 [Ceraceosorus guamensis]
MWMQAIHHWISLAAADLLGAACGFEAITASAPTSQPCHSMRWHDEDELRSYVTRVAFCLLGVCPCYQSVNEKVAATIIWPAGVMALDC